MTIPLQDEFAGLEAGQPVHFRSLTLLPLLRPDSGAAAPGYLLLEDAMAQGLALATELDGGSVPELRFENRGELPVLLLDGEELIGAKQNRVLNLTILAPAKQAIVIPVSCVEAGRWRWQTPDFKTTDHVMYSRARAARTAQVTDSMRMSGARSSDQSAVWEEIADKAVRMAAPSPTQAMSAIYERHAISVEEYLRAFSWQERQAGIAFAIGGKPLGLDLLDNPATMQRLFPKLIRSYTLDALDAPEQNSEPVSRQSFLKWLEQVASAQAFTQPAVGLGKDVRFRSGALSGAALWALDRYVHICAFAMNANGHESGFRTRISRPGRRRGL